MSVGRSRTIKSKLRTLMNSGIASDLLHVNPMETSDKTPDSDCA